MSSTSQVSPARAAPAVREGRTPLVSVCIPTRNRAPHLRGAIASALTADVDDLEVLVFDDASEDDTEAAVRALGDPRITYRRHPRRVGIARNRNTCLLTARGRYLAWLDDDDAYLPGGLETQLALLEREPDVVLAHGAVEAVEASGRRCPGWESPFREDVIEGGTDAFSELVLCNYIHAPSVVARASAQHAAGLYATDTGDRAEDWDAWLRLALEGDVGFTAHPVARYRCHARGVHATRSTSLAWLRSEARVAGRAMAAARGRLSSWRRLRRRARVALASRGLETAGDALARGRVQLAARAVRWAARFVPPARTPLIAAAAHARSGDEHRFHRESRAAREWMADFLAGTRYGATLRAALDATAAWSSERSLVAQRIRQVVPPDALVAAVDKWDPSLLHEAGRHGWHFPDLSLEPAGYPADDWGAIRHLDDQHRRGAEYLVLPRAAFWWLEHYVGFSRHLARYHDRVWADEMCVIYRLRGEEAGVLA